MNIQHHITIVKVTQFKPYLVNELLTTLTLYYLSLHCISCREELREVCNSREKLSNNNTRQILLIEKLRKEIEELKTGSFYNYVSIAVWSWLIELRQVRISIYKYVCQFINRPT